MLAGRLVTTRSSGQSCICDAALAEQLTRQSLPVGHLLQLRLQLVGQPQVWQTGLVCWPQQEQPPEPQRQTQVPWTVGAPCFPGSCQLCLVVPCLPQQELV